MHTHLSQFVIFIFTSAVALVSWADDINLGNHLEKCPFGEKYSIECVDCFCDPLTGTSECSDEQCVYLESKCPNGTKFAIGCGNICRCNENNGDTVCMVLRCRKKYIKLLQSNKLERRNPISKKL